MQKLLVAVCAVALLGASVAYAAAPGTNLGWNNCATTAVSQNLDFTCDDNNRTFNMIGSFQVASPVAQFVGVSAVVDIRVNDAGMPPWWQFGSGGCREGALGMGNVGALGGCQNSYAGSNQGGGFVVEGRGGTANWIRVRADWARDNSVAIPAATLQSAFVMQVNSSQSFDDGFGFCVGCATAACFVLNSLEIFDLSAGSVAFMETADVRNWATWQGGLVGTDVCPIGTPTQARTWGQIKALYR